MKKNEVVAFAKKNGYDGAEYLGKWKGYKAYEPTFEWATEESPAMVGPPLIILVNDREIRMSTVEEAYATLDVFD